MSPGDIVLRVFFITACSKVLLHTALGVRRVGFSDETGCQTQDMMDMHIISSMKPIAKTKTMHLPKIRLVVHIKLLCNPQCKS